jgi:hypothetical protein
MNSLLKIIFLGIIAGITYKYLNERGINIVEKGQEAYDWAVREGKELSKISDSGTSAIAENYNDNRTSVETYNLSSQSNEANIFQEQPGQIVAAGNDEAGAEEFPIPEKESVGTENFPGLDEYAREASAETLASWLRRPASNDLEKMRLIFTWVATHIHYDDNGYNTGNYSDVAAESVLRNRVGVCQGYSNLFNELAKLAGLESVVVTGFAKGISYRPGERFSQTNHAWNAVRIDGEWKLLDVTWAAGYGKGVNGRLVTVMQFEDYWFNTCPEEFIFTHFPEDESFQFNQPHITIIRFENMPYASSQYFKLGFNGRYCFPGVLNGTFSGFPRAYGTRGDIRMLSMPSGGIIPSGSAIKVRIKSDNAVKIAWSNNGRITDMNRSGNEFSAILLTATGPFCLMANFGGEGGTYGTFLEYEVE